MNIGLVMSGGVAKGAYQAGFLKAIKEIKGSKVTCLSCASIGILNGYAYAADKIDKLWDLWRSIHFDSIADLAYNVWFKHFLRDIIHEIVCEKDVLTLPLYAPICYLPIPRIQYYKLEGEYLKKWYSFIRGAISFPFISGGIRFYRGQMVIDGGMMDNIPIQPLLYAEQPDLILVLHFEAGFRPRKRYLERGIPIIDYDVSLHNHFRKYTFNFHEDILKAMVESGYEYGQEICAQLFGGGENDLQSLLVEAKKRQEVELSARIHNYSLDTLVQRANEIFYPFIRKKGNIIYDISQVKRRKIIYGKE